MTETVGTILVVDDDADAAEMIAESLRARGFKATPESNPGAALEDALDERIEVVLTDLQMRSMDGLELCQRIAAARPDLPVVVVTGHASVDAAVGALRAGAFDFVVKPVDADMLQLVVGRAVQHHRLKSEVHRLRDQVASSTSRISRLLGESPAMERVLDVVSRIAPTDATVLITGESGTGKELVARAIHEQSARGDGPFIAINCAAVPATLLESELFGHAKGAFTDAKNARRGLFLEAQGGTLFLDEIGEMPLEMQVKLLRALQERTVRAVGGQTEQAFDARVIAATNRSLEKEVQDKRFREDLYYRINVCSVLVPPLREREGDVPVLAHAFVERFAGKHGKAIKGIAAPAMAKLVQYQWPGNVRELENGMERAVAMAQFDQVMLDDLPERVRAFRPSHASALLPATVAELVSLDTFEQRYILHVLGMVKGNKSKAARILGCDRRTLYRKLEQVQKGESGEGEERSDTKGASSSAPPPARPNSVPAIAMNGHTNGGDGGRRILVVDDDQDNLELVQILLRARGYDVQTATGVAEAMRARNVDAVLTDLNLGDGSGADLVGRFGGAPVMVMTGSIEEQKSMGFDAWLTKPVSLERLTSTLTHILA
jgi:two-component system response regulator HydG